MKIISKNKKAHFSYEFDKRFETGISLAGWEVKSLRKNLVNLNDAYIVVRKGEAQILNMHITPLTSTSTHHKSEPTRSRILLLHKMEIATIAEAISQKNMTCIPLEIYLTKGLVKLKVALARGKKLYDKRKDVQNREWKIEQSRLLKNKNIKIN